MTNKELETLLRAKPKYRMRVLKKILDSFPKVTIHGCYGSHSIVLTQDIVLNKENELEILSDICSG